MTNTTRRTALMGAIAVPLAASAAALPAMASEPDPIFEVIEAHKRAYQAFDETIDALMAAEERYAGQFGSNSPSVVLMTRAEWDATVIGHPWPFGDHDAKRLSSGEDIDRHTAGPAGKHSKLRNRLRAELAEATRAYRRDLVPLQRAWDATSEAETQARADIAWTEPTTMAGVVAALNHIRTMTEKGERLFDDHNDALGFLYSIEASVRSIAGMPPIDGADEKAEVEHA